MGKNEKLISVVVPVYNAEKFIEETIKSVLDQTYREYEIIVVDDGSTDRSIDIVKSVSSDIRVISQANRGCAAACTVGMKAAVGEFIQILGADDILYACKFDNQMDIFVKNEDADGIFCDFVRFSTDLNNLKKFKRRKFLDRWKRKRKNLLGILLRGNIFQAATPLIRKEWYEKVGYYDERLTNLEDWNAFMRMAQLGAKFYYLDEVLVGHRRHDENKSDNSSRMNRARIMILDHFFQDFRSQYSDKAKRIARSYGRLENAKLYRANHDYRMFRRDLYEAMRLNPFLLVRYPVLIWKYLRSYFKRKK
jgi:glycosyltransferase involved in cell wall biosynthesis